MTSFQRMTDWSMNWSVDRPLSLSMQCAIDNFQSRNGLPPGFRDWSSRDPILALGLSRQSLIVVFVPIYLLSRPYIIIIDVCNELTSRPQGRIRGEIFTSRYRGSGHDDIAITQIGLIGTIAGAPQRYHRFGSNNWTLYVLYWTGVPWYLHG